MKEYSKEEKVEIIKLINAMQKFKRKYVLENNKVPTSDDIIQGINITKEKFDEINFVLYEIEKQDEEYKLESTHHTKEDIKKKREIRKRKKAIKDIQKYMKDE